MTVDPGRLRALLDRIAAEGAELQRLAGVEDEEFAVQPDLLAAVKYRFIVAIEASIDTCRHIAAARSLRAPTDFADAFAVLREHGVLDPALARRLQDMARFRLLLHGCARVDDARVLVILRSHVVDLDAFRGAVARSSAAGGAAAPGSEQSGA